MSERAQKIIGWFKKRIPRRIATTLTVVAMAYALTTVLVQPFSYSLGAMSSMASADFSITDMYQQIANSRSVRVLSPDIVIVDINNCTRAQIAETIEMISLCDPRAIGLDVCFAEPRSDDDRLVQAISLSDRLVAVKFLRHVKEPNGLEGFEVAKRTYFEDATGPGVVFAASNYPTGKKGGTIRRFCREFAMTDGDTIPSFALALAKMAYPDKTKVLENRPSDYERIYFPSTEFRLYSPHDLYENAEELTDKIVIVGTVTDPADVHRTPLNPRMAGTIIQAHAVNTILTGNYLSSCPKWVENLVALFITSLFVYVSLNIKSGIKGMMLRFLQMLTLYLVLYAGYWFFIERNVVIDFSRSFLMMAFAFFAVDIWNGLKTLFNLVLRKLHDRKLRRSGLEESEKTAPRPA